MTITFSHNPQFEFENFRASFGSKNHAKPSPRQELFLAQYHELTRANAVAFSNRYFREHQIDSFALLNDIERRWREVEVEFFRRADRIFGHPLPLSEVTVYLTAHDRCSYNFSQGFFLSIPTPRPSQRR